LRAVISVVVTLKSVEIGLAGESSSSLHAAKDTQNIMAKSSRNKFFSLTILRILIKKERGSTEALPRSN
jgi:hypothetical protein